MRPAPGRAPRPTGAPRAAACTPRAARSPARPVRRARSAGRRGRCAREMPLRIASQLPRRSQPGAAITPGVSSTREPTVSHRVHHGAGEEVHLDAGGRARPQELDAARRHAGPDVRRGQPALRGPHHLVQPAQQWQVAAHSAQQQHRGVAVGVDQPGQQHPGQLADRAAGGRGLRERPHPGDAPVRDVDGAVAQDRARGVARQHHRGGEPRGPHLSAAARAATAGSGTAAATRRCRGGSPASFAAAARGTRRRSPRDRRTRSPRR